MKSVIKVSVLVLTVMLLSAVFLSAQEHNHMHMNKKNNDSNQMMDAKKIDKNNDGVIYECPMKCEPASDKPGECSKCGMTLKKISVDKANKEMMKAHSNMMKKDKKADCGDDNNAATCCGDKKIKTNGTNSNAIGAAEIDKNKDGYVYECPMKCEPASDKPGECSKCGMNLKKVKV